MLYYIPYHILYNVLKDTIISVYMFSFICFVAGDSILLCIELSEMALLSSEDRLLYIEMGVENFTKKVQSICPYFGGTSFDCSSQRILQSY